MTSSVLVRSACANDHALYVRFAAELGTNDPPRPIERWLAEMAPTTIFLERDQRPIAYGWYEVYGRDGYVRHVVVDPSARRQGLGARMMRELAARLRETGCERWRLNVKSENAPAIALYRAFSMEIEYPTSVVRVPWRIVDSLPRAARSFEARALDPADDAAVERVFGLPRGRIETLREHPDEVVLRVLDPGAPRDLALGVACFDPCFPGCFPFRVERVEFARTLLEAIRPRSPSGTDWIQLVVEDDPGLARLLIDKGSALVFEILHMSGAIPA